MQSIDELLARIGVPSGSDESPELAVPLAAIVRKLRDRRDRTVGLLPASDAVGVPAIALQIGHALARVTGEPTGVVDASGSWWGAAGGPLPDEATVRTVHWIAEKVALFTPRPFGPGRAALDLRPVLKLRRSGSPADERFAISRLVVDLTGLERSGEQVEVIAMLDAAAVVARAGRTTALEIDRRLRDIPPAKSLGVLLLGA
jgi:hypothetical protein